MTMEPSLDLATKHLQSSEQALSDAGFLLQDDRLQAAANRAYYAMFHAAMAALAHMGIQQLPRTHRGTLNQFGQHCIVNGPIDPRLGTYLRRAQNLLRQSDYQLNVSFADDQVAGTVQNAQAFVAEIRRVTGL